MLGGIETPRLNVYPGAPTLLPGGVGALFNLKHAKVSAAVRNANSPRSDKTSCLCFPDASPLSRDQRNLDSSITSLTKIMLRSTTRVRSSGQGCVVDQFEFLTRMRASSRRPALSPAGRGISRAAYPLLARSLAPPEEQLPSAGPAKALRKSTGPTATGVGRLFSPPLEGIRYIFSSSRQNSDIALPKRNAMKTRLSITAVIILVSGSLLCGTALAQSQSNAQVGDTQSLPPGLDQRFLDTSADPCVDFFQYACGNFAKYYPIPNDRSSYSAGALLFDHNEAILHAMLEKAASGGPNRTPNQQKIGDYYAACMDTSAIDGKGIKVFQAEFDRINALKDKRELSPLLAHFQLINVNTFLGLGEQQDFKDATKQIAAADQGGLGLPERDYYLRQGDADEKIRKEYVQHITNTLKLLGESDSDAAKDAANIFQLETALAKASMDVTSRRDPKNVYHMMPVDDLQKLSPALDWTQLLAAAKFPTVTEINVVNPDYFKGMNAAVEATDLNTIKAYLRWQLVVSADSIVLPKALDDEHFDFFGRKLRGQPQEQPRWKRCVQATDRALGEALGEVYVAQEFPASSKAATLQMVHDIETAMNQDIDTLDWMSPETKTRAKAKLHAVADKIGYPDHWRDYSKLAVQPR